MRKTFNDIRTLAALLIASAALTACSNDDGGISAGQPAQEPQAPQVTLSLCRPARLTPARPAPSHSKPPAPSQPRGLTTTS